MAEILNFALVGAAPANVRSAGVPAQFQDAVDRHQNNLVSLSAALKTVGITPFAAGYVNAALAGFQNGLIAAVAEQKGAYLGQH